MKRFFILDRLLYFSELNIEQLTRAVKNRVDFYRTTGE